MGKPPAGEEASLLARRLKQRRLRLGLTQTDLAQRSGISQGSVSHIERGGGTTVRNLYLLAQALGLLPSQLLEAEPSD